MVSSKAPISADPEMCNFNEIGIQRHFAQASYCTPQKLFRRPFTSLVTLWGSLRNNLPFWTPMHPVRQPVQNLGISRYSCNFTPCRPDASSAKITNLFIREPLGVIDAEIAEKGHLLTGTYKQLACRSRVIFKEKIISGNKA